MTTEAKVITKPKMKRPNNIEELRDTLLDTFTDIANGDIELNRAQQLSYNAGKVVSTLNTQLQLAVMCGEKPSVKFLEVPAHAVVDDAVVTVRRGKGRQLISPAQPTKAA